MPLPFGRIGPTRPESIPRLFRIYAYESDTSSRGRERRGEGMLVGEVRCILSKADPKEQERYRQTGVTVSHRIIERGTPTAKENYTFALVKGGQERRFFRVRAVHNKGELDIDTLYDCEERSDVWCESD